jgi:uroporphyrinogen decarboxylase
MTSKERVATVFKGGIPDRVPIQDGYWEETLARWQNEGLPEKATRDRNTIGEYFGTEIRTISVDASFLLSERVIEEDDRYITKVTKNGMVVKYIKGKTSTPGLISFPVGDRRDWDSMKERLVSTEGRLPENLDELCRHFTEGNWFVVACVHDPYEASWSKLGPANLLETMKTDPEFAHDVFKTITDLNLAVCEELFGRGHGIDGGWIWGDIAYSKGLLFSPQMYEQILYPYHKRLVGFFTERGLPVVYHSDGDLRRVIPLLLEAGVRCLQPLEAKAGMDLFELKRRYGDRLVLMGNVDFEKIAAGRHEADQEIKLKVGLGKQGGGYIYHSDHSVPPNISLECYRWVLDLVEKYGRY